MPHSKPTNELEFQGQVVSWLNNQIGKNPGLGLDRASVETPSKSKRNDLVVWVDRAASRAFLTGELKTPSTPISDPHFLADACRKAHQWGAPYFFVWNMQSAEIYATPPAGQFATPENRLREFPLEAEIRYVEDWLDPARQQLLKERAMGLLQGAVDESLQAGAIHFIGIDASLFVDRLSVKIAQLRALMSGALRKKAASSKKIGQTITEIAAQQGFIGFVDDLYDAVAGQYAYRLVGQVLFYFALRRKLPKLKPLVLAKGEEIPKALLPFWSDVRRYDYEALFEPAELDTLVPVPPAAQLLVHELIEGWSGYDWAGLEDDVLGSVFEKLIPANEQMQLGQFYTPNSVADLVIGLTVDGERPRVLDPGCGSGTFLMRTYSNLRETQQLAHGDLLPLIWGFDVSAFAAELAVINLVRQDFSENANFPRVLRADYFDKRVGQLVDFPPAKAAEGAHVKVPIPQFDAIVGNPPYLRSQNQDDLDPSYRKKLFNAAARLSIGAAATTDLFGFFLYHSFEFLRPGGRMGFVTSASWLTTEYGAQLQRVLLERCRIVALVTSKSESFFSQVDVNTVLVIAERRTDMKIEDNECIRFVSLKKGVSDLLKSRTGYWKGVRTFSTEIEAKNDFFEDDRFRVVLASAKKEQAALSAEPSKPRNWSQYHRAPLSFFELFENAL